MCTIYGCGRETEEDWEVPSPPLRLRPVPSLKFISFPHHPRDAGCPLCEECEGVLDEDETWRGGEVKDDDEEDEGEIGECDGDGAAVIAQRERLVTCCVMREAVINDVATSPTLQQGPDRIDLRQTWGRGRK